MNPPEKLIELAVEALAISIRKTWQTGGRSPKTFRKTQTQSLEEETRANTYIHILDEVYEWSSGGASGVWFKLVNRGVKQGLLLDGHRHKEDPPKFRIEDLQIKGQN